MLRDTRRMDRMSQTDSLTDPVAGAVAGAATPSAAVAAGGPAAASPAEPVGNPCINICRMDQANKYCQGCGRTSLEIGLWDRMSEAERAQVMASIEARRPARRAPARMG